MFCASLCPLIRFSWPGWRDSSSASPIASKALNSPTGAPRSTNVLISLCKSRPRKPRSCISICKSIRNKAHAEAGEASTIVIASSYSGISLGGKPSGVGSISMFELKLLLHLHEDFGYLKHQIRDFPISNQCLCQHEQEDPGWKGLFC